ncbi:MAG: hypothetical protein WBL70_08745 [Candidatus Acidiferrales bacterium]
MANGRKAQAKKKSTRAQTKSGAAARRKVNPARGDRAAAMLDQSAAFQYVFGALRAMLETLAPRLSIVTNKPDNYYLNTISKSWKGRPLAFAAVQIKKNYVSYHLVPVYMNPGLLATISPALKKHMQGKGCFNFTEPDLMLFAELAVLTTAGFREYEKKGLL